MSDRESIHKICLEETHRLIRLAEIHYRRRMPTPSVEFNLRGRSAGMVCFPATGAPRIRYNSLMLNQNRREFLARTLPHEVAHLVARTLYGAAIKPHGVEWREVMAFFGAPAKRCHDYPLSEPPRRQLRRFSYHCGCRRHRLSSIRHNRIQRGQSYLCRRCGSELRPDDSAQAGAD